MAYHGIDPHFPLTKESQVGSRGKKHRQDKHKEFLKAEHEYILLADALSYLIDIDATYFRIMDDNEWN